MRARLRIDAYLLAAFWTRLNHRDDGSSTQAKLTTLFPSAYSINASCTLYGARRVVIALPISRRVVIESLT
jgi:hypothetical protein